jgi:predicted O-methyltransferase YrrM
MTRISPVIEERIERKESAKWNICGLFDVLFRGKELISPTAVRDIVEIDLNIVETSLAQSKHKKYFKQWLIDVRKEIYKINKISDIEKFTKKLFKISKKNKICVMPYPEYRPKFKGEEIQIGQLETEILGLVNILKRNPPERVLEIGTFNGGTLYMWTTVAKKKATIVSIELPNGYPESLLPAMFSYGKSKKQKIHLIEGDSHEWCTPKMVSSLFCHKPIDFLFIDGDHTYEGAKKDFQMYSPFVRKGGIIALHDIKPFMVSSYKYGVSKLWEELKMEYKYKELVQYNNQQGYGIGVLFV